MNMSLSILLRLEILWLLGIWALIKLQPRPSMLATSKSTNHLCLRSSFSKQTTKGEIIQSFYFLSFLSLSSLFLFSLRHLLSLRCEEKKKKV